MSNKSVDTYFFDAKTALETANQQNRIQCTPRVDGLQICYYNGGKLKNAPENCIHVPLKKVYGYFLKTKNRFPTAINYDNTHHTNDEMKILVAEYTTSIKSYLVDNLELIKKYQKKIKKNQPDFSEKRLRVFIAACRQSVVMKEIYANMVKSFRELGCEVLFFTQKNDMQACSVLPAMKALYKFNPHITFNINHIYNEYLHKDVFNFIWFQDKMPILTNKEPLNLRQRDFIFTLIYGLKQDLIQKGYENIHCKIQSFCIDTDIYKCRKKIKRKEKIVFIGSSYKAAFDAVPISKTLKLQILYELLEIYIRKGPLSIQRKEDFFIKYQLDERIHLGHITNYIERDMMIKEIIKLNLDLDFELYGYGWDEDEKLKFYNKGVLKYGKDISKVYNSAKYSLIVGGYVMQQRTLESSSSGSIPVVLDVRHNDADYNKNFDQSMIFFRTPRELTKLLKNTKKYNFDSLVNSHSYAAFAEKTLTIVERNL